MSEFEHIPEAQELTKNIDWKIPTKTEEIQKYVDELETILQDFEWKEDDAGFIPLAFNEALANAMVHGNMGIDSADAKRIEGAEADPIIQKKQVHISGEISKNKILLTIQDEGGQEGVLRVKKFGQEDPTSEDNLLKPKGRGGLIMESAFGKDGVNIETNDLGVKLTLTKTKPNK